jgi:uncharacterized protein (TIGR00288 family)
MSQERDTNIALLIDFDNVALGARDARQRFDIKFLMQRLLEKGKILVKKAYADWHFYKEHMSPLHEAAIELIEIPAPRISGKNSADIKLVVDAMELCYTKDHIDTFVIVSGDSDFSPLVSKLRENNKRVIGVGVKNSSSHLLINNCDEFIFYDNIFRDAVGQTTRSVGNVPSDKREMFEFLVGTVRSLLQESRGVLYSSLIKDTMTRKMPDFNERSYGYSTFGDMLDDSRRLGLLVVERDARAGGTWVVQGLGDGKPLENEEAKPNRPASRRRRRPGSRGRTGGEERPAEENDGSPGDEAGDSGTRSEQPATASAMQPVAPQPESADANAARKKSTKKVVAKKVVKKPATKKAPAKKAPAKKVTTKKTVTKKAPAQKKVAPKATAKKAPAKKVVRKKAGTK